MLLRLRRCAEIIGVRVTFSANPQTSPPADARAGRESRRQGPRSVFGSVPEDCRCNSAEKNLRVHRSAVIVLVVLALTACGGGSRYAGLSRAEAVKRAKTAVEAPLDPSRRPY